MKIHLPPELEKIVNEELKIGHFRTAEEVIAEALQALREKEKSSPASVGNEARRKAVREMLDFVENNRVRLADVTVKELIHEGHRLGVTLYWTLLSRSSGFSTTNWTENIALAFLQASPSGERLYPFCGSTKSEMAW